MNGTTTRENSNGTGRVRPGLGGSGSVPGHTARSSVAGGIGVFPSSSSLWSRWSRWCCFWTLSFAVALAAGCGSQDEERPATWNYIATAIIEPNCATANCHSALSQRSGVQLDRENRAYHALVDRFFVIPGHPEQSALMDLLHGQGSRRMPPDFPLADQDIALIGQWIQNGANP